MNPRLVFPYVSICLAVLLACVWFIPPCSAAESSDAFRERFNLPADPEPLLQRILSTDEFKEQPTQSLLERLEQWAKELLLRALKWLVDRMPSSGPLLIPKRSIWYVVAGLILAALLIFVIAVAIRILPLHRRRIINDTGPADTPIEEVEPLSSRETWDLAIRLAEHADYSEAIVYMFRSVLLWLDEQGKLAFHPSKTNRELLAGVGKNAEPRQTFAKMIPVFDRVKYGGVQCDQLEYERFLALCRGIMGRA